MTLAVRRDLGGLATASMVAMAAIVLAWFLASRTAQPSEPATVPADAWDWSTLGARVVAVGDESPIEDGDIVASIFGRSLAAWALDAFRLDASPAPPPTGAVELTIVRDGQLRPLTVAPIEYPILHVLAPAWPLVLFVTLQLGLSAYLLARRPQSVAVRALLVGSTGNFVSAIAWQIGMQPSDVARGLWTMVPFMATGPINLVFWSSILHVVVVYPVRSPIVGRNRWIEPAIYIVPIACLCLFSALAAFRVPTAIDWIGTWARLQAAIVLGVLAFTLAAMAQSWRALSAVARRQVRWVAGSVGIALTATLALIVVPLVLTGASVAPRSVLALIALPVSGTLIAGVVRDRLFERDSLARSRERIVLAREDERRRLRRELHDGLGPVLAGAAIHLDVARGQLDTNVAAARAGLDAARQALDGALSDVRRLSRDLRPPALDELGLVEALRERVMTLTADHSSEIDVAIEVEGPLPALPAAVEVAAFRIASEAALNAMRHGSPRRLTIVIAAAGPLIVQVEDDGVGLPAGWHAGVGVTAMRERAAEIGGAVHIEPAAPTGTRVIAILPRER